MEELKSEKRKISNNARLESIKRWKHARTAQTKCISEALNNLDSSISKNKKIIFDSDNEDNETQSSNYKNEEVSTKNKVTLFESSGSEEDDDDDRFKIKKQFEGERGKQLFEMSVHCTDERFKLDERFQESDDDESNNFMRSNKILEAEGEAKSEKEKNFEILEKVLGFQVPKTHEKSKKRKYVRFDPESENAAEFIKKQEEEMMQDKKNKKSKKEDKKAPVNIEPPIVSSERFYEVSTNLKDLLSTSEEQFSLGKQFKLLSKNTEDGDNKKNTFPQDTEKISDESLENDGLSKQSDKINKKLHPKKISSEKSEDNIISSNNVKTRITFFMQPNDKRLKEGINFFQWNKPLNTIREQWPTTRNMLLEAYKNRRTNFRLPKQKFKSYQKPKQFYK